jgi:hypothetical protein
MKNPNITYSLNINFWFDHFFFSNQFQGIRSFELISDLGNYFTYLINVS